MVPRTARPCRSAGVPPDQHGPAHRVGIGVGESAPPPHSRAVHRPDLGTPADYELALSNIFRDNAFLPVLFLILKLISGQSILPGTDDTDLYLTALAMSPLVYATGLLFWPRHRTVHLLADPLAVLILYAIGIAGLFTTAGRERTPRASQHPPEDQQRSIRARMTGDLGNESATGS